MFVPSLVPRMHIPDGFIDVRVSALYAAIAVVVSAMALRSSRKVLDDATAPLAGLIAVFVFAVQMLNFPVAAGTSGHLMGGALAAVLVGPGAGMLAVTVVLLVQGLVFHDGGLTALGLNITNMAILSTLAGWIVFRAVSKVLPKTRGGFLTAAGIGAFVSVPVSAAGFVLEFALGGTTSLSLSAVASAMLSVHVLIGIGEAIITVLTVGAVLSVRPDLVYGIRGILPTTSLVITKDEPATPTKA